MKILPPRTRVSATTKKHSAVKSPLFFYIYQFCAYQPFRRSEQASQSTTKLFRATFLKKKKRIACLRKKKQQQKKKILSWVYFVRLGARCESELVNGLALSTRWAHACVCLRICVCVCVPVFVLRLCIISFIIIGHETSDLFYEVRNIKWNLSGKAIL